MSARRASCAGGRRRWARLDGQDLHAERTTAGWRIGLNELQARASTLSLELGDRAPAADGLGFGERYVHTMYHSCHWMPCAGPEPGRASVAISLDLPAGCHCVASGPRPMPPATASCAGCRPGPTRLTRWALPPGASPRSSTRTHLRISASPSLRGLERGLAQRGRHRLHGRRVRAHDLQWAMEASAGKNLQAAFDAWVY